ncbi:unnamed protein product [Prorocentrum cordatum]|uniref:Uncharacterized protein n=1 Tax=Prorocentrum cordatum TaxID=2364126 RepID=A0ABN9Y3I5_9DINO|nr:unnamed protein product [Polarella glacialis]
MYIRDFGFKVIPAFTSGILMSRIINSSSERVFAYIKRLAAQKLWVIRSPSKNVPFYSAIPYCASCLLLSITSFQSTIETARQTIGPSTPPVRMDLSHLTAEDASIPSKLATHWFSITGSINATMRSDGMPRARRHRMASME